MTGTAGRTRRARRSKTKVAPVKKSPTAKKKPTGKRWSRKVNETSDAMDLQASVFKLNDSRKMAASLKRSAEKSRRRKAKPFQSAMSMLNFYINRAGKNLSASRIKVLEKTKEELRKLYHREPE